MVPQAFITFFSTSASAGAALVGLLFVAVSIAPHETVKVGAPIERQATSASAFTALLDAFFISLAALIPNNNLGIVTFLVGGVAFLSTLALAWQLLKNRKDWRNLLRRGFLVVGSLIIYGYECYFALLLIQMPTDVGPLDGMAGLLLGVYGIGIVRAWQLLGARRFGLFSGWLNLLHEADAPHQAGSEERPSAPVGDS